MKYEFETNEFGVSSNGIHLLRNRYNYKTYDYREIDRIEIGKGRLINNWVAVMVVGLALVIGALYYAYGLYLAVAVLRVPRLYVESFVIPIIPLFVGLYCLWNSLRTGARMKITCNGKASSFPLIKLIEANQLESFQNYLKGQEKLKYKYKIQHEERVLTPHLNLNRPS